MDFIRKAKPPVSSYVWILQSILTFSIGTFDQCPLLSLQSIENWNTWPHSRPKFYMHSLAEQPQLPYGIFNTLWSSGSTLNHLWVLEKLHTSSYTVPLYASWTLPDLWLTTNPIQPGAGSTGLSWGCGLFWLSCTRVMWWIRCVEGAMPFTAYQDSLPGSTQREIPIYTE